MAKKYDTNPLDGEVLQRAEEVLQAQPQVSDTRENKNSPTQFFEAQTRPLYAVPTAAAEQQTRRFAENHSGEQRLAEPYHSVFAEKQQPPSINTPVSSAVQQIIAPPTSRKVLGLGLPENITMVLPYLPLTMGAIAAVIILLFASRTETRVRFHAAQGLALHLASWIVLVVLKFVGDFTFMGDRGADVFQLLVFIYFIVSIVRVWQGKANHIEALDDVTDFLNEKIKPRK